MKKMESKTMMILGGYGGAGVCISQLLLQETDLNLILAGRNAVQANKAAEQLNSEFGGNRVRGMQVNASSPEALRTAFKSCDIVMSCIPITSNGIGGGIVQAAFDAGINYIDLCWDDDKRQLLKHLEKRIKASGKYFMTEAGFMPGVLSMMVFLAAKRLDALENLEFAGIFRDSHATYGSIVELLIYAADPAYAYKEGAWREVSKTASKKIDFGPGFGKITCYPMDAYELRCLPDHLGFKEINAYASGINPIADLVVFFLISLGLYKFNWSRHLGVKLLLRTIKKFLKPPYTTTFLMEASGKVNNRNEKFKITIGHEDAYIATAIATIAGVLQLLDGAVKEPGVIIMGHHVEPERYVEDVKRLGMNVQIEQCHVG